jgi:hypothetical protein
LKDEAFACFCFEQRRAANGTPHRDEVNKPMAPEDIEVDGLPRKRLVQYLPFFIKNHHLK